MLDIKIIRENPEEVKRRVNTRNGDFSQYVDDIIKIDAERRAISTDNDALKAKQNAVSKQIPQMKKNGEDTTAIMAEMKELAEKIKADDAKIAELEAKQKSLLLNIPNMPNKDIAIGKDDTENVEIRKFSEPTKFDFEPKAH